MVHHGNESGRWETTSGVQHLSLKVSATARDLVRVVNGGLTLEDLVSVLLCFRLSQFAPTKIRTGCKRGGGRCICVPFAAWFP